MSYLTPFAEKPKVFAPVLSQKFHGAFRCAQATVRGGSVDALTVVLKLHISRTLKAWLVLLYYNHGVLYKSNQVLFSNACTVKTTGHHIKIHIVFLWPTHISLINISASFSNAFQALANDRHHMLLCVWEQDVALRQLPYSFLIQVLQFLVNTKQQLTDTAIIRVETIHNTMCILRSQYDIPMHRTSFWGKIIFSYY